MKKIFIVAICALLVILGITGNMTGEVVAAEEVNKITVMGTGEVRFLPDVAVISVGVETLNESLTEAQSENSQKINALISYLKDIGVQEENIKTRNFYVYQRYDYSQGEKLLGYQVNNYLDFKTKDVDNVGNIVSSLMENGANRFTGISFTIDNYEEGYRSALNLALENATKKAQALTEKPIISSEIVEEGNYCITSRELCSVNMDSSIMKGEICIKASVRVQFEY